MHKTSSLQYTRHFISSLIASWYLDTFWGQNSNDKNYFSFNTPNTKPAMALSDLNGYSVLIGIYIYIYIYMFILYIMAIRWPILSEEVWLECWVGSSLCRLMWSKARFKLTQLARCIRGSGTVQDTCILLVVSKSFSLVLYLWLFERFLSMLWPWWSTLKCWSNSTGEEVYEAEVLDWNNYMII